MPLLFLFGSFCIAFLLTLGLNWLALIPWRRSIGQHWTERARLLYPVRMSARMNLWLISLGFGVINSLLVSSASFFLVGMMAYSGALLAGYFFNREIFPSLSFSLWLRTMIAILFLFFLWFFPFLFTVFEMPENFGLTTWLIAAGIFALFLASIFGLGIILARWLRILLPSTEALKTLVDEVSQKMRVPARATWILPSHISNAAAFPHTRQLVFTSRLLSNLSDEEVKTVCAHELGHLSESGNVRLARGLLVFALFPAIFFNPLMVVDDKPLASWIFLTGILWMIATVFFALILARRMEKRADKMAIQDPSDAAVYARAMARIYEANQMPAVMPRRSAKAHPALYDRMTAAGVTPDFPRPLPPKKQSWTSYALLACIGLAPLMISVVRIILET